MISGRKDSRKMPSFESHGHSVHDADGLDDYGVPTMSQTRGSTNNTKKGFFGRLKRNNNSVPISHDDSEDESGSFDVIPGLHPSTNYLSEQMPGQPMAMQQNHPYGMDAPGQAFGSSSSLRSRTSNGEISMDQISSIRDRHRYPGMHEDPKSGGRSMSLSSMSTYDTTPVIPTLGITQNLNGSSKLSQPQDKYRQRMIESRRALQSSEAGVPTGNSSGHSAGESTSAISTRTMSMGDTHNQIPSTRQGRNQGHSAKSSTTSSQLAVSSSHVYPPPQSHTRNTSQYDSGLGVNMNDLGHQGYRSAQGYGPAPAPVMGYQVPGQMPSQMVGNMGGQMSCPMGFQVPGQMGFQVPGQIPGQMGSQILVQMPDQTGGNMGVPLPANMGSSTTGSSTEGASTMGSSMGSSVGLSTGGQLMDKQMPGPMVQRHSRQSIQHYPQQGPHSQYSQHQNPHPPSGTSLAPPVATPQLNGYSHMTQSPGMESKSNTLRLSQGSQPLQVCFQNDTNDSHDFDFGNTSNSTAASHFNSSENRTKEAEHINEELYSELEKVKNEVRVLSIELAESARRELNLPPSSRTSSESRTAFASALAKAHSQLSLERAKRTALEKATQGKDDTLDLTTKLAELEYKHSEAVHLLSTRTDQYNSLKTRFNALERDYNNQHHEKDENIERCREREVSQYLYKQDEELKNRAESLEAENRVLRETLHQYSSRGPLNERVTALEDQRSALQEALRAMRERKDAEIRALTNRIEMLSSARRASSSGSIVTNSAGVRVPTVPSMLQIHGSLSSSSNGVDETPLGLPRMRALSLSRPTSPLHLGLDYNK